MDMAVNRIMTFTKTVINSIPNPQQICDLTF